MFLSRAHLPRRAVLRGLGATVALPLLDAMTPALARAVAPPPPLLICLEQVHGAAGCSAFGQRTHLWAPAAVGTTFDLSPTALRPLEPYRDALTIVSNTDVRMADPTTAREIGGDHFRSSAVFLTQARPRRTAGPDVEVGPSLDQLYARRFGQDTPIPSLQLCIEPVDTAGGCQYGYSCHYVDALSWSTATTPLPMIRDPRVVFDQLFNVLGGGMSPAEQRRRRGRDRSILDWVLASTARLAAESRSGRSPAPGRIPRQRPRGGAADPARRGRQPRRRRPRPAWRPGRRARLVLRARPADVRPAGGGPARRHHPGRRLQARPRRLEPRLSRERRERRVPQHLAPRRPRGANPGTRPHQRLSCVARGLLPGAARPERRRRRVAARPRARPLRIADGRPQPAQPSQGAVPAWPAMPAAASAAAVTCAPPTGRRWPT